MEYAKAHPKLLYGFSLIAAIVGFLLIAFATPYVVDAYYAHWLVLAVVITLCASPFGNHKLAANASEKPRHDVWHWLLCLFLLELSLFFIFLGMTLVYLHWLPVTTTSHPFAIGQTLTALLEYDGLLPWAIYALYAGRLGFISYVKNEEAYSGDLILPLLNKKPGSLFSTVLNIQARSATFTVIATTFAFMTLLIAVIITPRSMPLLTGFHGKTLIIVLALILLGFTPPFKKILKALLNPKIPLFISTTTTLTLFAILIWLLNVFFGHIGQAPIKIPDIIQWLERKNPNTLWIIFSAAWWIGWTPLIAAHIAKLSRGYRIRSIMLATLILPLLFTLLIIEFPAVSRSFQHFPLTVSIVALIAFVYLLAILTEKTVLPMMIRNYLPKRDLYKRRDHYFYFRKLFQIMLMVIYLYLPAGISVTVFVVFMLSLSFTLQIPFNLITSLCQFNKK